MEDSRCEKENITNISRFSLHFENVMVQKAKEL